MSARIDLRSCCTKIGSGATPKGGKESYLSDGPYSLIRSQNVLNDGFTAAGLAYISQEQAEKLDSVAVEPNDVLLNITGDSVARVCQVAPEVLPARVNQHVAIIRPDPDILDPKFLRYFMVQPSFQEFMLGMASVGATRNALTKGMIEAFEIPRPDISEQREIAATLGALDDKIELNRKTAATLEAMARALYRSWFVDFDPVRAKSEGRAPAHMDPATAALFPDRFGEDGLPEGWTMGTLGDLSHLNPESHTRRNHPESIEYVDLSNTKWGTIEATTHFEWEEAPSRARLITRPGDTIIGTVRPGNGSFSFIGHEGLTASTGFAVLRPKSTDAVELVYLASTDPGVIENLASLADGGAYPAVRPDIVAGQAVSLPDAPVLEAFSGCAGPWLERIETLKLQSRTLAALRGALLPKLMSGELRVPAAREMIADAASDG